MKTMITFIYAILMVGVLNAQEPFSKLVGPVQVGAVKETGSVQLPYIIWGADVATFHANGGLKTTPDSIFAKQGLNFNLTAGDDFVQQVRDYMTGVSPYGRGTMAQIGQASEVLNSSPKTKPVIIFQMSWSAGDHIVGIGSIKELGGLKKMRVALQRGGPHIGLLDDALRAAGLTWNDIIVVWCKDLTGTDDSPAAKFRAGLADAACVISPDMIGLTGGLDTKGTGAEGTVKDARVVVSTAQMSRSIADVYFVRQDYFTANRDKVQKFFAGYLQACEVLLAEQKKYDDGKGSSPVYLNALKMAQTIYGEAVLPTIEIDAHGLMLDATLVRLPGNVSFFTDPGNVNGFENKMKNSLDLAVTLKAASNRFGFVAPNFDYRQIATLAGLEYVEPVASSGHIQGEIESFTEELDENTILTFTIDFKPNQNTFSVDTYGSEFKRVIENASTFGNAVFAVRGHADPTATLRSFLQAGIQKGIITRSGESESSGGQGYVYRLRGNILDLNQTDALVREIQQGNFTGASENPNQVMQAALNLSLTRAEAVKTAIIEFAKQSGINLDASQIQPQGVGIREPIVAKPSSMEEAQKNMRVEFRLIKVPAEALKSSDFDF